MILSTSEGNSGSVNEAGNARVPDALRGAVRKMNEAGFGIRRLNKFVKVAERDGA